MRSTTAVLALACVAHAFAASMDDLIMDALQSVAAHPTMGKAPVVGAPAPAAMPRASYRPVVLMHGLGDAGSNPGMQSLAQSIMTKYPGSYATAVDVADGFFSFITPVRDQIDQFAAAVRADPKLANGFNVVGLSQGGIVVRGYVEIYNDPPVYNMVSICGVLNGVFDCPLEVQIIPFLCDLFKSNPYRFLFNGSIPLSFSDYFVTSMNHSLYLTENTVLPDLNNQLPTKNATYTANFKSLNQAVLVEATEDTVVYPFESEQFGGYRWGTTNTVFNMTAADFYLGDYFGLKTLDQSGRVKTLSFVGDHLRFSDEFWNTNILPFFDN